MSGTAEPPSLPGSARVLVLSTVVMAGAAAAVLALGTQDARLLRLGVVAALWAALLAAFTTVRARHETSSRAEHADQLRAVYQLELQREVAARREHALTVERAIREQAQLSQQREIGQLRAELAAVGSNLAQLLGGNSMLERVTMRAESTRLVALPAQPRQFDDSSAAPVAKRPATTPASAITAAPVSSPGSLAGAESRFGPGRPAVPSVDAQGRHGVPGTAPAVQAQRTVQDLLAAHGAPSTRPVSTPRRRRTHEDRSATSA